MTVSVGYPRGEVEREIVVEHRIARTPRQQRGHRERTHRIGDMTDCSGRRMLRGERYIGDELRDRVPVLRVSVRRPVRIAGGRRHTMTRQHQRAINEDARAMTHEVGEWSGSCDANERRGASAGRNGHTGVAQHHAGKPMIRCLINCAQRPSKRDRPAPVVCRSYDRSRDVERFQDIAEVGDALDKSTRLGALGIAHAQLINSDDAVASAEAFVKAAPVVRPGWIAVHAHDGAQGLCRAGWRTIEHVPGTGHAVGAGYRNEL